MSMAISGSGMDSTLSSLANERTASGQTLGEYWLTWITDMHHILSRSPGVQITRATITVAAGDQQLGAVFDLSPTGALQYTSFIPATTANSSAVMGRNARMIKPASSQSMSGFITEASEPPKKSPRPSSTMAPTSLSSKSQSGYTTARSQSTAKKPTAKKADSTKATETGTSEGRAKKNSRQTRRAAPTIASTGVSEFHAVDPSTATKKSDMTATPAATTGTSLKSTKSLKMELSKATDSGISDVSSTATPIASKATTPATAKAVLAPTATTNGTNKVKKKKGVKFTDKGFTDRSEATSVQDIPNKRQNKEYTTQSYRDDLTDVDDRTASRLSRYAKAKRLQSYQKLAQETGVPLESASEFYALASNPATDDDTLKKFPLKHWTRPKDNTEIPYAYSAYVSEFPSALTIDSSVSKDVGTKPKAKVPSATEYQNYLEQVVKIANERGVNRKSFLEYTSAESVAPKDDAGLEAFAKSLGNTREDFDAVRKATVSGAPVMWTEEEYQNVIRALPPAKAK
jgi:hypothetical protein